MGVGVFFVKNDLFQQAAPRPPYSVGQATPTQPPAYMARCQRRRFLKRFPVRGDSLVFGVIDTQGGVQIRRQPVADLSPKGVLFRCVLKIHTLPLFVLYWGRLRQRLEGRQDFFAQSPFPPHALERPPVIRA